MSISYILSQKTLFMSPFNCQELITNIVTKANNSDPGRLQTPVLVQCT